MCTGKLVGGVRRYNQRGREPQVRIVLVSRLKALKASVTAPHKPPANAISTLLSPHTVPRTSYAALGGEVVTAVHSNKVHMSAVDTWIKSASFLPAIKLI